MGPLVCSLLSACVVVFVIHLAPVQAQCDGNVLTAMLSRLQHTVDRLQDTVEQLRKDHKRSTEQLLVKLDEALGKRTECTHYLITNHDHKNTNMRDPTFELIMVYTLFV